MKELIIVVFVSITPVVFKLLLDLEVTTYSLIWQGFATISILMWQSESYKSK